MEFVIWSSIIESLLIMVRWMKISDQWRFISNQILSLLPGISDSGNFVAALLVAADIVFVWSKAVGMEEEVDKGDNTRGATYGWGIEDLWADEADARRSFVVVALGVGVFFDLHSSIVLKLTFCWMYESRNSGCWPRKFFTVSAVTDEGMGSALARHE